MDTSIVILMDKPSDQPIKVLAIGCACGDTLLHIKNKYPQAELTGIEFSKKAAASADLFAGVITADSEQIPLPYSEGHFDYIILADVLEHLKNPWQTLLNLQTWLKPDGQLLASISNVTHFTVLRSLLQGHWHYEESGILAKTHLRFFTLQEMNKMFENAGYGIVQYLPQPFDENGADREFIDQLTAISQNPHLAEQVRAYQYLIKAVKAPAGGIMPVRQPTVLQKLVFLLRRIEQRISPDENLQVLLEDLASHKIHPAQIAQAAMTGMINSSETLLMVAVGCFQKGHRQYAQAILEHACRISSGGSSEEINLWRKALSGEKPNGGQS